VDCITLSLATLYSVNGKVSDELKRSGSWPDRGTMPGTEENHENMPE
jgi:hypothetical protein